MLDIERLRDLRYKSIRCLNSSELHVSIQIRSKRCVRYTGDSDVGDLFKMLMTGSLCWRCFPYVDDFFSVLNRSPTSHTCHQYISSPTSMRPDIRYTV